MTPKRVEQPLGAATMCVLVGIIIACTCLLPCILYVRAYAEDKFVQLGVDIARQRERADEHREQLARVIGSFSNAEQMHLAALVTMLRSDPDDVVAFAAAEVLSEPEVLSVLKAPQLAQAHGEAGSLLGSIHLELLKDENRDVRLATVRALGGLADLGPPGKLGGAAGAGLLGRAGSTGTGRPHGAGPPRAGGADGAGPPPRPCDVAA